MPFWIYSNAFGSPDKASLIQDTDEDWHRWLSDVVLESDKKKSAAVCAAEYAAGTTSRAWNDNLIWCHGLVLDVDNWRPERPPFQLVDFQDRFAGLRFVLWSTYSSLRGQERWRLVLPLASPMPPDRYESLFSYVCSMLDGAVSDAQHDPCRLGFLGSVASRAGLEAYQWHIQQGERLDWTQLDLAVTARNALSRSAQPAELVLSPDALSDAQALDYAKRFFSKAGLDVEEGSRHSKLMSIGCQLWWDFALDEEAVTEVLHSVNRQFEVPKSDSEVHREVRDSYDRTRGPNRVDQPASYGARREPQERATRDGLKDIAKRLKSKKAHDQAVARAFLNVVEGKRLCEPADAGTILPRVITELVAQYPKEKPEKLLDLLLTSISILRDGGTNLPPDEELLGRFRWHQNAHRKRADDKLRLKDDKQKRELRAAFCGTRETPYTNQELKEFERAGLAEDQWIIQHGKTFYVFVDGAYRGPIQEKTALQSIYTYLSPAELKINRYDFDDKTGLPVKKSLRSFMDNFGSVAMRVERSMGGTTSGFDHATETLYTPTTLAHPTLQPKRIPQVEEWLKLLAGDKFNLLQQWLTSVTYLEHPLAALALVTKGGAGKNLFVHGLAQLWQHNTPHSFADFNPQMLELCPIVWCDEKLPSRYSRDFGSFLKRFMSEELREVKKPYVEPYIVRGYARMVLTANDLFDLQLFHETMNRDSKKALLERLLVLDSSKETRNRPREYLESLGSDHRAFVTERLLAQHVLWIRDNVDPDTSKRFLVADVESPEAEAIADVMQQDVSRVIEWIVSCLLSGRWPNDALMARRPAMLYANSTQLQAAWDQFDPQRKGIGKRELQLSLAKIAAKRTVLSPGSTGRQMNYRILDMDHLRAWCAHSEQPFDEVEAAINLLADKKPCSVV